MQSTALEPQSTFELTNEQINTQVENDTVILNLATGKYYSLEGVGSKIWQGIIKGQSLSDIEQTITTMYKVSHEESQVDIHAFIDSLRSAGLIKICA